MSVHIYFSEALRHEKEFMAPANPAGTGLYRFRDILIYGEKGRLYVTFNDSDELSDSLLPFLEGVSLHATTLVDGNTAHRECGTYKLGTAEGKLELEAAGGKNVLRRLEITAKTLEEARELAHRIKAGTIRPDESYEGEQSGLSRAELEAKLSEANRMLDEAKRVARSTETQLKRTMSVLAKADAKVQAAYALATAMWRERWPWCRKNTVIRRIHIVLGDVDIVAQE